MEKLMKITEVLNGSPKILTDEGEKLTLSIDVIKTILSNLHNLLDSIDKNPIGYVNTSNYSQHTVLKDLYHILTPQANELTPAEHLKHTSFLLKWCYNLFILHLLLITVHVSSSLNEEENRDTYKDYQVLEKELTILLDPTIRVKLRKQGVGLQQNIYCGYDTEYQNLDSLTNALLSVQLALSTQTVLKLPLPSEYSFGSLNPQTNVFTSENTTSLKEINHELVLDLTRKSIKHYRDLKYPELDGSLLKLILLLAESGKPHIKDKDSIAFIFSNTTIRQYFERTHTSSYTMEKIVTVSKALVFKDLENSEQEIFVLLKDLFDKHISKDPKTKTKTKTKTKIKTEEIATTVDKIVDDDDVSGTTNNELTMSRDLTLPGNINNLPSMVDLKREIVKIIPSLVKEIRKRRTRMSSFSSVPISVSVTPQMYLLIHNSAADLSILTDFKSFKEELDLVNKCFVTLSDPLIIDDLPIKIRDTQLLAPGTSRSLHALSTLYPNIEKLKVSTTDISDMASYWKRDPKNFRLYALQDALITLVHGCRMAQFNLELGGLGVPVTLSSLSGRYLKQSWSQQGYSGYQANASYLLSDSAKLQTPRGLFSMSLLGLKLSMFIGNFKGGRNETFMYGIDTETEWHDYDVVSAYTTVMAMMGDPAYDRICILSEEELNELSENDLLYSYTIIHCNFEFDNSVKFPSIGCFIDQTTTVYPLKGTGLLSGAEYLLAKTQGCKFTIIEIVYIP